MASHSSDPSFQAALQHHQSGRVGEAETLYRQVLARQPANADALHLLGLCLHQTARSEEGAALIRQAIAINPDSPEYHGNLGVALAALKRPNEAVEAFRRAVALRADWPEGWFNLARACTDAGLAADAIAAYRQAAILKPDVPEAHFLLGNALTFGGQFDAAATAYRRALELRPNWPEALYNLANALRDSDKWDDAAAAYRHALQLRPQFALAENNLGNLLKTQGQLDEAIGCFRRALGYAHEPWIAGNLLYTLHFHPAYNAQRIYQEHVLWNQRYARPLADCIAPHPNGRQPDRRLRIGYVSPDFRYHPVGLFMLPLLAAHDHSQFETVCYCNNAAADGITAQIRAHADQWRDVFSHTDEQLAVLVRQDQIDILVDLSLHNQGNRLLAFARKPAPVQVTYLAYCSTTGLETIDYRLADPYFDPPGQPDEVRYSEQSVRLPRTYWCYRPPPGVPPVGPLPAEPAGVITFGCLNNYAKVTQPTLETWARILMRTPGSRMIVHCHEGGARERARAVMASLGVDPQRLAFVGKMPLLTYFEQFQQISIALDPFPYPGGTTTCDGLWMGVPAVTLAGDTAVSRNGVSILSNVGLPELIAHTPDEYVQIATDLAADRPRLIELRSTLRIRMEQSPLMNAPQFARDLEAAYRKMWRDYVARQ